MSVEGAVRAADKEKLVRNMWRRAPAAAVDRDVLVAVVERSGFVDVGDGSGKDAHAGDFGLVCDAKAAGAVLARGDLAGASGTVVIVGEFGGGEVFVVVEVVRVVCVLSRVLVRYLRCIRFARTKFSFKSRLV